MAPGVSVAPPRISLFKRLFGSLRLLLVTLTVLLGLILAFASSQAQVSEADKLVKQAYYHGSRYLQSNEKKSKKQAKGLLSQAEKVAKNELKQNKNCEPCQVNLVRVQFYRALFRIKDNYGDCFKVLDRTRKRYPDNVSLLLLDGYASYNTGQWARGIQTLQEFLLLSSGQPEREDQVRKLLETCRGQFMNGWYRQQNFYASKESEVSVLNPNTFKKEIIFKATPQWERNLGQFAFSQLTANARPFQDPELQSYLEQLVARLVEKTPGPFPTYKVTVVDSPAVNAVTTPGHVVVYTGLIKFVENEAQLASVLSHELAHNYGHHSARKFVKTLQVKTAAAGIIQALNPGSVKTQLIATLASQIGLDLFVRAYTRFEETEADRYGAHIAFNAGYDPTASADVFLAMFKQNPKQGIKFLRTHPPMPNRIEYISDYLMNFPLENEMRSNSEEFQRIQARLNPTRGPTMRQAPGKALLPPP